MRILYILKHNPWGIGGGCYACRNYLELFSELFKESQIDACICEEYLKQANVNEFPNVSFIPVKKRSKLSKLMTPLTGLLHRHYHQAKSLMKKHRYDYCIFDENGIAGSLVKVAKNCGIKTIVLNHNCQYEYSRDNMTSFLEKLLILPVVVKCERVSYRSCDLNIFLTAEDEKIFARRYGNSNTKTVVGGCFFAKEYKFPRFNDKAFRKKDLKIIISGTMGNVQNLDGINYFLECLLPHIPDALQIVLAGKNPPKSLLERVKSLSPRVSVIPNPKDMDGIVGDCDIFLCPARLGGGMKLRVMDGFRNGLPVLAHSVSARGYREFEKYGMMREFEAVDEFASNLQLMLKDIQESVFTKESIVKEARRMFAFEYAVERMKRAIYG